MTDELPPLPLPAYEAYYYSAVQMRAYAIAAVAREREKWIGGIKVSFPTDAMEQEIASHVRRAVGREREKWAEPVAWQPMDTAPKDGTSVRLLIADGEHPLSDDNPSVSIGSFGIAGGPDEDPTWTFAGWCWHQDCYTKGTGTPIGWLPAGDVHGARSMPSAAPPPTAAPPGYALVPKQSTPEIDAVIKEVAPKWFAPSVYSSILDAAAGDKP